jgi:hypothetical protein
MKSGYTVGIYVVMIAINGRAEVWNLIHLRSGSSFPENLHAKQRLSDANNGWKIIGRLNPHQSHLTTSLIDSRISRRIKHVTDQSHQRSLFSESWGLKTSLLCHLNRKSLLLPQGHIWRSRSPKIWYRNGCHGVLYSSLRLRSKLSFRQKKVKTFDANFDWNRSHSSVSNWTPKILHSN